MKQYVKIEKPARMISFSKSIALIFAKIETLFFTFLCIVLIISSRINSGPTNQISFYFVDISLPIIRAAAAPFNFVINFTQNLAELTAAQQENIRLKNTISDLNKIRIEAIKISQENKELRKTLNFAHSKTTNFKTAQIIGRTNEIFNQKLYINAGKNQNIQEGS